MQIYFRLDTAAKSLQTKLLAHCSIILHIYAAARTWTSYRWMATVRCMWNQTSYNVFALNVSDVQKVQPGGTTHTTRTAYFPIKGYLEDPSLV